MKIYSPFLLSPQKKGILSTQQLITQKEGTNEWSSLKECTDTSILSPLFQLRRKSTNGFWLNGILDFAKPSRHFLAF
jgi:hypothetical protein